MSFNMTKFARWLSFLIGFLFLCANASYALSVTKTPISSANCTNVTGFGTKAWSRPDRAFSQNNSSATRSLGTGGTVTSNYLKCVNYGFAIPTGAVINGLTISVLRKTSSTSSARVVKDAAVYAVKGGVIGGSNLKTTTAYTTTLTLEAHGGASSLWGQTWTAADINAATFGAAFAAIQTAGTRSATASVDVISITVDYASDTTPPTVLSVNRANTSPTGVATVSWDVTFSEAVTGVDASDFSLVQTGGVSGAGSISVVPVSATNYTVTASSGSGSGTLGLNLNDNDSIIDASGNKLGGTGTGFAGGGGIVNGSLTCEIYTIDRANPVVNSINRVTTTPTNAASLQWTVVFSESVSGVDATDFATAVTGSVSNGAISVSPVSATTYTVTVAGISGAGSIGLNLLDNDSIVDTTAGNKLGGAGAGNGSSTGQVYIYDRVAPSVVSISADSPSPFSGNQVSWTVTFSESVTGVDLADFSLAASSGLVGTSFISVTGSGTTWSVLVDTGYGAGTLGLNLVNNSSIVDSLSNPLSGSFTGDFYTISSTPPIASYRMDESFWNGTTDEVVDQQGLNPGTSKNSATTADGSRALTNDPGTCRYGLFYNASSPIITKGYVDLTVDFPYLTDDFTLTSWIRTTSNSTTKQWIFTHSSSNKVGYALSLGDAGTGRLRFRSGTTPTNLDSPSTALANNTWYFVAVVADFSAAPSVVRKLYVFDASGALLSGYPVSVSASDWDDTEAGAARIGGDGTDSFRGNLDEIQVFDKVLNQAALASLAQARHSCGAVSLDHLEIQSSSGATGLTCASNTLTISACQDTLSPCTPFTGGVNGSLSPAGTSTVNWDGTTGGATGNGFAIAAGSSSVTKSFQVSTAGSVVLGASASAPTATNATTCNFGSPSCTFTLKTAGFIFTNSATSTSSYTVPAQVSGVTSSTMYLRALDSTNNPAVCTPAIISQTVGVSLYYSCNNPSSCQSGSLASINSTAIDSNSVLPTSVNLSFDANASAPMTVRYDDVGRITLNARKIFLPFSGASNITLTGSSNAFVVAPHHFSISGVTAGPIKAGSNFAGSVTAYNGLATPTVTKNFGLENTLPTLPEGVSLSFTKCLPSGAGTSNGSFSGSVGSFSSGIASASNLNWSEVGNGDLVATLTSGSYLGSTLTASGTTASTPGALYNNTCNASGSAGNVGRFIPDHFETAILSALIPITPIACPSGMTCPANAGGTNAPLASASLKVSNGMVYANQPFTVQVTAKNAAATPATTVNYQGSFAKATTLSTSDSKGGAAVTPGGGTLSNTALAASAFAAGVGTTPVTTPNTTQPTYALGTTTTAPGDIFIRATEAFGGDGVTSLLANAANSVEAGIKVANGRIKIPNAYGSEKLPLPIFFTVQYYNGSNWVTSVTDNALSFNSALSTAAPTPGNLIATKVSGVDNCISVNAPANAAVASGVQTVSLSASAACSYNISLSGTPSYLPVSPATGGRATFGIYKSPLIYRRENY